MKVGLVPISAKPYHAGHHYLVELAAKTNDKVVVFASTSDRFRKGEYPISGEVMKEIWINEILKILPENVDVVFGGSPVRKVYETIGDACDSGSVETSYKIYSDVVDTKQNYPVENRVKYMNPLWSGGLVEFPAETLPEAFIRGSEAPDVRGEDLRGHLQNNDFLSFSECMPPEINSYACWRLLRQ